MVVGKIKTIIFGSDGMLGKELCYAFPKATMLSHKDIDITDKDKVIKTINRLKPDVVINAAAYTDVDGCERFYKTAYNVNGNAPGYIAEGCASVNARLIHFSTDYVFDGSKRAYTEFDMPNPINVYGKSKLQGEINIIKNMNDYRIIRTSWLFGKHGNNFVNTMLNASKFSKAIKVVNDQFGKPTYTFDLALKTKEIINEMYPGIYHITNEGICSWYEFAKSIIDNVEPCLSDDSDIIRLAKRPKYSVLINTKTNPMRHWKKALTEYLNTYKLKKE